ncbi:Putative diacylglycerol O-acyltransferase [Anaerolineae bacterium]|nr:Putative diacylglycerol O-acyltransferase [Anaerolineae bacterium]
MRLRRNTLHHTQAALIRANIAVQGGNGVPRSKHGQVLGPVDMAFYYVDSPETPMNIGALAIFEGRIPFDPLRKLIDTRIHQIPVYQQKIVQAPLGLSQPTWAFDPDFNIAKHVYWHELPSPGDEGQLQEVAGRLVSGMLDRSKPLWEIHMIEGLSENRTAILFKIHHCMVDGLAAIDLFTLLFDLTPEPSPLPRKPVYDPPPLPSGPQMIVEALVKSIPNRWNIFRKLTEDISVIGGALTDKDKRRKMFSGVANVLSDNVEPIRPLPINGRNTGRLAIAWADFSLTEIKGIKASRKSSVNDVMLTILATAIEKYVHHRGGGGGQESLRVLVPVSMRAENERENYGNRISVLPIDVPFGFNDPLERLRAVSDYTATMKDSSLSNTLDMVLTMPSLAASWAQPLIWKIAPVAFSVIAHMWCTNVAGPQIPMYLQGHKLINTFGYFPLNPSMGLACVIASYNQRISMTLIADMAIVPEINEIRGLLYESFIAMRTAANVREFEPIKLERARPAIGERGESAPPLASPSVPVIEAINPTPEAPVEALETPPAEALAAQMQDEAPVIEAEMIIPEEKPKTEKTNESVVEINLDTATKAPANGGTESSAAKAAPAVEAKLRIFTDEWAKAYQKSINNSESYHRASTRWEAGSLAFVLHAAPKEGYPESAAVLLDLHKGVCRNAFALTPKDAQTQAAFIIEGDYATWMDVLQGKAQPFALIMRGKLRLAKGSMPRLLPFTQSAAELLNCAKTIS